MKAEKTGICYLFAAPEFEADFESSFFCKPAEVLYFSLGGDSEGTDIGGRCKRDLEGGGDRVTSLQVGPDNKKLGNYAARDSSLWYQYE